MLSLGADEGRLGRRARSRIAPPWPREIPLVGFYLQTGGRRHRAAGRVLAPLRRDRQRGRDQDGAVQPLPHARRGARRGRRAAPKSASRCTPATTTTSCSTCWRRYVVRRGGAEVQVRIKRRAARPLERVDASARCELLERIHAAVAAGALTPSCSRSTRGSPTATAPSSTSRTISPAASPAATRCCAARACSRAPGAWTRRKALSPGQAEEIDRVCREHPELDDDAFVAAQSGALAGLTRTHPGSIRAPSSAATRWAIAGAPAAAAGVVPVRRAGRGAEVRHALARRHARCAARARTTAGGPTSRVTGDRDLRRLFASRWSVGVLLALLFTWSKTLEALCCRCWSRST